MKKWLYNPIYRALHLLAFQTDPQKASEIFCKRTNNTLPPTPIDPNTYAFTLCGQDQHSLIYLPEHPTTPEIISILAHECLHATNNTLFQVNIYYNTQSNNEAFAYNLQWLLKNALEESRKFLEKD